MSKILITGAAGLIGSALAKRLHSLGHELILLDDLSHGYMENLIVDGKIAGNFHAIDIRSEKIFPYFEGVEYVFHMAAISSLAECQSNPGEAISINVGGTANVLEASRRNKIKRFIFASTNALYENNIKLPYEEDDEVSPNLIYPLTKAEAEKVCRSFETNYGMEVVMTRYHNVYGPNQDLKRKTPAFVGYALREAFAGRQPVFHSDGLQKRDYVYLDDVNELNMLCMTHPKASGQIINVCSGKPYSVREMYAIIQKNIPGAKEPVYREASKFWDAFAELKKGYPLRDAMIEKEVNKSTLGSTEKAFKVLGWKAHTTMDEGMKKTIEFFKESLEQK